MKKILVLTLIVSLLATSAIYFADPSQLFQIPATVKNPVAVDATSKVEMLVDNDHNKLFDNLEERMNKADDNAKLPVIVMYTEAIDNNMKGLVKNVLGATNPTFEYDVFPGMAVELTKGQINALTKLDFVKQVEYDMPIQATNDGATYWFGADKATTDFGVTGDRDGNAASYSATDIVVAVIDTGIYTGHVDLDGGKVIGWKDYVNARTTPYDDNGHGSHVAGTIAGEGQGNSAYKGVAPGAALVGVKVLDANGSGSMSNVDAGINWVVQNKATYGVEIISMSLGASGSSNGTDSTSVAINNAVNAGITCVVAAGNEGPARYTIGSPAAAANAITVGAMADVAEKGFSLAYFSSRGPTADGRTKPDIAAPGVNIMSVQTNTASSYQSMSGTSMATPFTSGTVALMLDANPSMTPAQVKSTLASTAIAWGASGMDNEYGNGRLDAWAAIKSAGGYTTGSNIAVPSHYFASGTIATSGRTDTYTFTVSSTSYPVAVSLIMTNWSSSTNPDFDAYLYNPSGTQVASATGSTRQDTINYSPTVTGTYTLKIKSYTGTGAYTFDLSTGGSNLVLTGNDL